MRLSSVPTLLLTAIFLLPAQQNEDRDREFDRHRNRHQTTKKEFRFEVSEVDEANVRIEYGLGELNIAAAHEEGIAEGYARFDPDLMTPDVNYRARGGRGDLYIGLESHDMSWNDKWDGDRGFDWKRMRDHEYGSELTFGLPTSSSLDVDMEFGLGEANIDLTDLTIDRLEIDCGLSDTRIEMNAPNPTVCRRVVIEAGVGDFNGDNLGNLRFQDMRMNVGLGSADLDLRGAVTEDVEVDIDVGLGSLDLTLPENVNIRLTVEHSFLSSVDVGGLVQERKGWISREWVSERPTMEIDVSVGLGSVDVRVR